MSIKNSPLFFSGSGVCLCLEELSASLAQTSEDDDVVVVGASSSGRFRVGTDSNFNVFRPDAENNGVV